MRFEPGFPGRVRFGITTRPNRICYKPSSPMIVVTLLFSCLFLLLAFAFVVPVVCGSLIYVLLGPCGGGLVSGQPSRIMMSGRTPPLTPLVGSSPADRSLPSPRSVSPASLTGCMVCLCFTLFLPSYFRQHPSGYGLRVRQSIYPAEAGYGQPSS